MLYYNIGNLKEHCVFRSEQLALFSLGGRDIVAKIRFRASLFEYGKTRILLFSRYIVIL